MKLQITILVLFTLSCCVLSKRYSQCSTLTALRQNKRPAYEFSIKLLQRITEDTRSNYVFSPLSVWTQLIVLSEGARNTTYRELWNATKHRRNKCFRRKLGTFIRTLKKTLAQEDKQKTVIAIDYLMDVKESFIKTVEMFYGVKIMPLDFDKSKEAANEVNHAIDEATNGFITEIIYYDDFISTLLLISDANYFKSAWQTQFNSVNTKIQPFYSSQGEKLGEVSMMNQNGYFNFIEFPRIDANVLELPFKNKAISMLVFLPRSKLWVGEIFYSLQSTRLTAIFNLFKAEGLKPVNVSIPRFTQHTEYDSIPELLFDMGVQRIFNPNLAELKGISNFKLYASLMTQISHIEVNEEEVEAGVEYYTAKNNSIPVYQFLANKPFAYMIVHRKSEFILYAGVYSSPSVYGK